MEEYHFKYVVCAAFLTTGLSFIVHVCTTLLQSIKNFQFFFYSSFLIAVILFNFLITPERTSSHIL